MLKKGFALIEIIVALLISSILIVSLYQIYNNTQRSVVRILTTIDLNSSYIPLYNQLEKDITGIFIPNSSLALLHDVEEEKLTRKIDNIFSCNIKDGKLNCDFLTTGGLKILDSSGSVVSSYVKRVFYFLEDDIENPGLLVLKYGSSDNILSNKIERKYDLANKLKKFEINFKVYDIKDNKKLINLKNFNFREAVKDYKTLVPAYVEITGIFYDRAKLKEMEFKFLFSVPSYTKYISQKDADTKNININEVNEKKGQEKAI